MRKRPARSLVLAAVVASGCAGGAGAVLRLEAVGDLPALRRALVDRDPAVRRQAAAAIGRYAAYDTSRPAMLATLERAGTAESRAAAQALIGKVPIAAPDPHGTAGALAGTAVIYFYRPAGAAKQEGPEESFAIDGAEVVRLRPGRFYRYETQIGPHKLHCHLPPDEGEPQKDMSFVLSAPVAGTYFVRHTVAQKKGKAAFDVMPIDPGLRALRGAQAAAEADVSPAETRRMKERRAE